MTLRRPPTRRWYCAALALVATGALTGCGSSSGSSSSNGVAAKPPDQILAAAKAAADASSSVHVAGATAVGGQNITVDLSVSTKSGATGSFSENGLTVQLVAQGSNVYVKASAGFWQKFGGATAAKLFADKWLKVPASNSNFSGIAELADAHKLVDSTLASHGKLAKGSTTTVGGQPAVTVTDTSQGGTLYVATTGPAYPLQIAKSGSGGGKLTFDKWDEPVTVTPPSSALDLSKLAGAG